MVIDVEKAKLGIVVWALVSIAVLLFTSSKITGDHYVDVTKWVIGIYMGAIAVQKVGVTTVEQVSKMTRLRIQKQYEQAKPKTTTKNVQRTTTNQTNP